LHNTVTFLFIDQNATGIMAPFPLITDFVINCIVSWEVWHSSLRILYFLCP